MPPVPAKQLASTSDAASASAPSLIAFCVAIIASAAAATAVIALVLRSRNARSRRPLWNNANYAGPSKAAAKSSSAGGAGLSPAAAASAIEELRDRCRQHYMYTRPLTLRAALRQPRPRWNLPAILELAEVSSVSDVAKRDPDCGDSVAKLRSRRGDRPRHTSSSRRLNRLRMRPAQLSGVRKAGRRGRRLWRGRRRLRPPLLYRITEVLRAILYDLRCDAATQPGTPQKQLPQQSPTSVETSTVMAADPTEAHEAGGRRQGRESHQRLQFVLRLTTTTTTASTTSATMPTLLSRESMATNSSGAALQLSTTDSGSDSKS